MKSSTANAGNFFQIMTSSYDIVLMCYLIFMQINTITQTMRLGNKFIFISFLLYSNWPMLSIFHITRQPSNNFRQFFLYNHISHNHVSHSYRIQVYVLIRVIVTWWCHQMETLSVVWTLCAGNSPVTGEFPAQSPVKRGFDVFFDMRLNTRLSKQSWG